MRLDVRFDGNLSTAPDEAVRLEQAGYDAAWVAEAGNDPFLALTLAAEHTRQIELGTGVAIALARSPMTLANTAWEGRITETAVERLRERIAHPSTG